MQNQPVYISKMYLPIERVNPPITSPIISSTVLDKFQEVYITPGTATLSWTKTKTRSGYTFIYKVVLKTIETDIELIPGRQPVIFKTDGQNGFWLQNCTITENYTEGLPSSINEITIEAAMLTPKLTMFFDGEGTGTYEDPVFTDNKVLTFTTTNLLEASFSIKFRVTETGSDYTTYIKDKLGDLLIKVNDTVNRYDVQDNVLITVTIPANSTVKISCDNILDVSLQFWFAVFSLALRRFEADNIGISDPENGTGAVLLYPHTSFTLERFSAVNSNFTIGYLTEMFDAMFRGNWDDEYPAENTFDWVYFDFSGENSVSPPSDWQLWDSPKYWNIVDRGGTILFNISYTPQRPPDVAVPE